MVSRERARVEALEVGAGLLDQPQADLVGDDLPVEQPLPGLGILERLGEQVVHLDDLDAAVAHLGHEVEMVALGVLHPHHVVEQERVAVRRRQPLVRPSGRADQDLAQLADLGMHAVGLGRSGFAVVSAVWFIAFSLRRSRS